MEAGEHGRMRGTCCVACSLEVGRRAAVDFVVCFRVRPEFFVFVVSICFFFERTWPASSTRPPCLIYLCKSTGVCTRCHYLISLFVCGCVTFVVLTDCESCTMPFSTNPRSMGAGEYGLTRRTCFAARRLEVVAVTGLLRDFVLFSFFLSNAYGLLQEAALPHLPLY